MGEVDTGTRSRLLSSAVRLFARSWYSSVSVAEICRESGLSNGIFYRYFPNKEALFREMVRSTLVVALESAEARLAATDSESADVRLRAVASGWWAFLRTDQFQVVQRLVMADLPRFPDLMQFYVEEVVLRGRRLISGILEHGIARGEFRALDPEVGARMLSALAMTHSQWCSRREYFPALQQRSDDDVRDELIEFYLHALRPHAHVAPLPAPLATS